jgi:hypothetical protein
VGGKIGSEKTKSKTQKNLVARLLPYLPKQMTWRVRQSGEAHPFYYYFD